MLCFAMEALVKKYTLYLGIQEEKDKTKADPSAGDIQLEGGIVGMF